MQIIVVTAKPAAEPAAKPNFFFGRWPAANSAAYRSTACCIAVIRRMRPRTRQPKHHVQPYIQYSRVEAAPCAPVNWISCTTIRYVPASERRRDAPSDNKLLYIRKTMRDITDNATTD